MSYKDQRNVLINNVEVQKFRSSSKVKPKYATLGAYSMAQVMYGLSFKSG